MNLIHKILVSALWLQPVIVFVILGILSFIVPAETLMWFVRAAIICYILTVGLSGIGFLIWWANFKRNDDESIRSRLSTPSSYTPVADKLPRSSKL